MTAMQVQTGLSAAAASDPGLQRETNEDRFHADPVRGLFVVVDGVGGQAAGEKAAETALALVRTRLERETGAVEDRVREAIVLANDEIHRLASIRPEWKGMACVLTIAVVTNGDVVVGHVGDTRLYKLRGSRLEKLTRDHSPVGEREDAGELSERDAMRHPRRNEVYRDVGSEEHRPDDAGFIDVVRQRFEPDAALLLCSDGLTDQVTSAGIAQVVRDFAGHPRAVVDALIGAANDAGGKDNVTVIYVEGPRFAAGEDTRELRTGGGSAPVRRSETMATVPPASAEPASVHARSGGRWRLAALVVLLAAAVGFALYAARDRFVPPVITPPAGSGSTALVVGPGDSIGAAIARAHAGDEVIVEPGEYRERLQLKTGVRVVSRVPRGATLRLPAGASETDAAVAATAASGAELAGFRILGDAATPLGIGVLVGDSDARLSDLEVTGARSAAVEFTAGRGASIVAAWLHDNPGTAIAVRSGAAPRIAHNAFAANATSEHAAGTLLVEAGAHPVITANTFAGVLPESVVVPAGDEFAHLARDNWFIPPSAPTPVRHAGRGRR